MNKFLVVDDNEQNRYLLQVLLQGNGYETAMASNGKEALEIAHHDPPDLIISDILMPEMDGFTLCHHWQKDTQLRKIPFVFYTATYTDPKDKDLALNLGAVCFLVKPIEPDVLLNKLTEILSSYQKGHLTAAHDVMPEDTVFLKEYNEALIRKLEDKMSQLEQANRRLSMLYQASTNMASIRPLDKLVTHTLCAVIKAMGYTHANFFSYDKNNQQFRLLEAVGHSAEEKALFQTKLIFNLGDTQGLVGLVGQTREPLILANTHTDPRWITLDESIRSALFIPVVYEERLLGVVGFLSTETNAFSGEDVRNVMTLANNIAIAIDNARLYAAQQQYTNQLEAEVASQTAELKIALEQAQETDRLKSQFVSDVNHELRTPLSNIQLYLGLLEQGRPENHSRYMAVLKRETSRLQQLIEELLDFSRLDAGKVAANLVPTNLNQLVTTLINDRGKLVAEKGISLDFKPTENIPLALADSQLLFQVLTNLLSNAINYTSTGRSITICTGQAEANGQTWATISVSDTGPGISRTDQGHVFDRFYRGEAGHKSQVPGTGLGLAICQDIVHRHGGRITVESVLGEGSRFIIWLQITQ